MSILHTRSDDCLEFLQALGIDTNKITKCVITFKADSFVTAECDYVLEKESVEAQTEILKTRKFELREIEVD